MIGAEPSDDDVLIGLVDSAEMAAVIVSAVNGLSDPRIHSVTCDHLQDIYGRCKIDGCPNHYNRHRAGR